MRSPRSTLFTCTSDGPEFVYQKITKIKIVRREESKSWGATAKFNKGTNTAIEELGECEGFRGDAARRVGRDQIDRRAPRFFHRRCSHRPGLLNYSALKIKWAPRPEWFFSYSVITTETCVSIFTLLFTVEFSERATHNADQKPQQNHEEVV